jgi:ABC-2 type transport system permease protein
MKAITIAIKDTLIRFRDRNAILLMIAAPLLISAVMGLAFGGQGQGASPISEIPLIVVNADAGELGERFAGVLAEIEVDTADGVKPLFAVTEEADIEAALGQVELGETRGAIYIPPDFSEKLEAGFGAGGETAARETVVVEIYTDPAANVSPGIIRGVVSRIAAGFSTVVIGNVVAVEQLLDHITGAGVAPEPAVLANLENLEAILQAENESFGGEAGAGDRISVDTGLVGESEDVNLLNYFVPSMSIFFLMFAVFDGTASILEEERDGTLHRLMTTPTSRVAVILGKIGGAFLSGILQFMVLVLVSALVFKVDWGSEPAAMGLLVLGTVAAATSLGALVASFARNNNQANVLGTAITLVFAILGGNFVDYRALPEWLTPLSKATINRWAMEGFVNLTLGGQGLADVALNIGVLFGLAAVFFGLAVVLFNRRFVK